MSTKSVEKKPEPSLMTTNKVTGKPDDSIRGEETEVTAQVTIPHDIKWGWMVVFGAFFNIFFLDGVTFTFGSMLADISKDLHMPMSLVALINSITVALYFLTSPLASGFINRYGFRECAMVGSIVCSLSLFITYFATKYWSVLIFYGVFAGIGYSFINMSSGLVVGFYFEKRRALAMAIAMCGSSCGIMIMYPSNTFFVKLAGWRTTTLLHSGLFGLVFFLGMIFRPLISFTITKTEAGSARLITYLPSMMSVATVKPVESHLSSRASTATATERMFNAVSNMNYPTAAEILESESQTGPSTRALTLVHSKTPGAMNPRLLKHVQSIVSRTSALIPIDPATPPDIEDPQSSDRTSERRKCCSCWAWLCHWEPHERNVRPMYRDDAFYQGRLESLTAYQKSRRPTTAPGEIGIEYHIAVTRATAMTDIQERQGVFTTSIRRVLATMMDPKLLRRPSFLLLCLSGFMIYSGFLVPYVYLQDRNSKEGIDVQHCSLFISTIGLSNAFGRLIIGSLAGRTDPLKLFSISCCLAGISTISSGFSYSLIYQYAYCCVFGFSIASVACLRSISLVVLYGLDKLTNATGMMLIFLGLGNLISTPLAGVLKNWFSYNVAFIVAGSFITIGGLVLIPVKKLALRENAKL